MKACQRCSAKTEDVRDLERHLVEFHLMAAAQAKAEAREVSDLGIPTPESGFPAADSGDHQCPKCGTEIACDWRSIGELERAAHRLKSLAGQWRARLEGRPPGPHVKRPFDLDEARRLVVTGLSVRAAARVLGASHVSVGHALDGKKSRTP